MIYMTGDTHADFSRFSKKHLEAKRLNFTEKDYVIVCGDFGLCWANDRTFDYNCKIFAQKPYTLLWIQGNHENYDMIEEFPIEEWHGGKVRHIIRDKVILLERGQIFEIDGKIFFTFGGASSHDIQGGVLDRADPHFHELKRVANYKDLPYRIIHESWWPQELPNESEMEEARANLEKVNYEVDYVITHCCATSVQETISAYSRQTYEADLLTDFLQELEERLTYKQWFFGHYHMDKNVDDKHILLYHAIMSLADVTKDISNTPSPGHPVYSYGDTVEFQWGEAIKVGEIHIVDKWGTFEQNDEPSYDIRCTEDNTLYKHVLESEIIKFINSN